MLLCCSCILIASPYHLLLIPGQTKQQSIDSINDEKQAPKMRSRRQKSQRRVTRYRRAVPCCFRLPFNVMLLNACLLSKNRAFDILSILAGLRGRRIAKDKAYHKLK